MKRYKTLASAFLRMLTLLIGVSIGAFILVNASPIDPLTSYIGTNSTLSREAKDEIADSWGLNDPPVKRFLAWGRNLLRGDMGYSFTYKQPVIKVITDRFQYSVWLMLAAWLFSGIIGFGLGIAAGCHEGKWFDRVIRGICLAMQSAPTFWIGLLVLSLFAVSLGWFPIGLAEPMGKLAEEVTVGDRIYHMVLPALTLSFLGIGKITLYTRQKLIEIWYSEFMLFARARGESSWYLITHHAIRNIALPAVTVQFASFSELFGGIALAETVFSYPGLGSATANAGLNGDAPLLMGIAIFTALFVFAGNMIANILYMIFDPRIREGREYE